MKRSHAALAVLAVAAAVMMTLATMKATALNAVAAQPVATIPTIPTTVTAAATRVGVIGDSYTGGSEMGGNEAASWTASAFPREPRVEVFKVAAGGSGYAHRGPTGKTFPELVPEAVDTTVPLVVVFGSRNDSGEPGLAAAATETYRAIKAANPGAKLLVIGPPWINENVPDAITANRDTVKAAALRAGATFVDPIAERWFFGSDADLIGSDGIHPTDEGHRYMADKIRPHLEAALRAVR